MGEKVCLVTYHMMGIAQQWYYQLEHEGMPTWPRLRITYTFALNLPSGIKHNLTATMEDRRVPGAIPEPIVPCRFPGTTATDAKLYGQMDRSHYRTDGHELRQSL